MQMKKLTIALPMQLGVASFPHLFTQREHAVLYFACGFLSLP
jgi:hypothetical protein